VDYVNKNKNIVLYFNRLSDNYLKSREFACFYNIWHAKVQLHMLLMKHENFIYICANEINFNYFGIFVKYDRI